MRLCRSEHAASAGQQSRPAVVTDQGVDAGRARTEALAYDRGVGD